MKILWIYPELPYPLTSGLLRGYYLLRELGKRHEVSFLVLTHQWPVTPEATLALKPFAERVEVFPMHVATEPRWLRMAAAVPSFGWRLREACIARRALQRMKDYVRRLLASQRFDVAIFSGRETIPVLKELRLPLAVDIGDANCGRIRQHMHYAHFRQLPGLMYRCARTRHEEKMLARLTPHRCFISTRDREQLLGPDDRSDIVPQGIDYAYWTRTSPPPGRNCLVFSGVMNYAPNADAALILIEKILPLVRRSVPDLRVLIVGRDPSPKLLETAARDKDITVTGAVQDMRPWLEQADVYVAALRFASGVQNKVLEAMAMQLPVVTTPVVAAGLRFDNGEPPLLVGSSAEELAAAVVQLLNSSQERARRAIEGRRFIEANCSWSASADKLERLCMAAAGIVPARQAA